MEASRARGVSLWLMPEGPTRERLGALIGELAARLGTVPFVPHVTLLPGIEGPEGAVLEAAGKLASDLRPLLLSLRSLEGRDEHFRCLIALAEADEPLRAAHAAAAQAFGRDPDTAFLPHLSLVYGSLAPETKVALAAELAPHVALSFEATRLHVWRTEGEVADWREIGASSLGKRGRA
jgi:2'-5' RNA ligase